MKMVPQYNFFILEVIHAWIDRTIKNPQTLHHQGNGVFMVSGKTMNLPSKMK
jgi:FMN-dependent NADH-azoreductase